MAVRLHMEDAGLCGKRAPSSVPCTTRKDYVMKRINLGAADTDVPGWLSCDIRAGLGVDVVANVKYLFVREKPDVLRASHVFEHVPPSEALYVLRTWHDSLKSGGILILGVPDFDYVVAEYRKDPLVHLCFWRGEFDSMLFKQLYGPFYAHAPEADNDPFRHHAAYSEASLRAILEDAGFADVERLHLSSIEENHGFDDAMLLPWSLNVQCRKPI